jgi:hypothetical protein
LPEVLLQFNFSNYFPLNLQGLLQRLFSYALAVLRIRDVYPGSDFFPSSIQDPGSRIRTVSIPDPGSSSKNLSILTPKKAKKMVSNL